MQGVALPNGNLFVGSAIIPELLSLYGVLQNKGYFLLVFVTSTTIGFRVKVSCPVQVFQNECEKKFQFSVQRFDTFCVIPHSVFNAIQCVILYKVCNLQNVPVYSHLSVTQCFKGVWFMQCVYYLHNMLCCTNLALRCICTQCVISHTLCNLCVFFYFYTNQVLSTLQCVVLCTFFFRCLAQ